MTNSTKPCGFIHITDRQIIVFANERVFNLFPKQQNAIGEKVFPDLYNHPFLRGLTQPSASVEKMSALPRHFVRFVESLNEEHDWKAIPFVSFIAEKGTIMFTQAYIDLSDFENKAA